MNPINNEQLSVMNIFLAGILTFFCTCAMSGQDEIKVKLSFKVILDPTSGDMPPEFSFEALDEYIQEMNYLMSKFNRGILFENTEATTLGGINHPISISYYNGDLSLIKHTLEQVAEALPILYKWRENEINIYINGTTEGILAGKCSFSDDPDSNEIILIRSPEGFTAGTIFHELGHFFDLYHTFQGMSGDSCEHSNPTWIPGNADNMEDTLPDHQCWDTEDEMSQYSYNQDFDDLSSIYQDSVTMTFFNMMSYRGSETNELTEQQLNKIADMIRFVPTRTDVTDGFPYFVNLNTDCTLNAACPGSAYNEFIQVDYALDSVNQNGNDVIVIRPGTYDVTRQVISQPVFMIGTREGDVVLK